MNNPPPSSPSNSAVQTSNATEAFNFLQDILDDSAFQGIDKGYALIFLFVAIAIFTFFSFLNFTEKVLLNFRIRLAAAERTRPASASNAFTRILRRVVAIFRATTYPQVTLGPPFSWLRIPPLGVVILLLIYLGLVLALQFGDNNIAGEQHYTALGLRAGWLAISQFPVIMVLASRAGPFPHMIGISYERFNVLHRWASRVMLLCATLHTGYQLRGWDIYGLVQLEWATDICMSSGVIAYTLLFWINVCSIAPIRDRFYEIFIALHVPLFIIFFVFLDQHLQTTTAPSSTNIIYAGVILFGFSFFHRIARSIYNMSAKSQASITELDGRVTKIVVQTKRIKSWAPGSHVLLTLPRLRHSSATQRHPATIASIPSTHNGDLIFLLKARKGFTSHILDAAISQEPPRYYFKWLKFLTPPDDRHHPIIDGPFGGSQSDPAAFDTALFVSGGTGITFALSNILSIAHRSESAKRLPVRRIEFIWVIKKVNWTSWVAKELATAVETLEAWGIEVALKIHVTDDAKFFEAQPVQATIWDDTPKRLGEDSASLSGISTEALDKIEEKSAMAEAKDNTVLTTTATPAAEEPSQNPPKTPRESLPSAVFIPRRPDIPAVIEDLTRQAEGEMGVFTCGPLGMGADARNAVARLNGQNVLGKGASSEGLFLHVESFGW